MGHWWSYRNREYHANAVKLCAARISDVFKLVYKWVIPTIVANMDDNERLSAEPEKVTSLPDNPSRFPLGQVDRFSPYHQCLRCLLFGW